MIWLVMMVSWMREEGNWNEKNDKEEQQGRTNADCAESPEDVMRVSLSSRSDVDRGDQRSLLVARHLFNGSTGHDD